MWKLTLRCLLLLFSSHWIVSHSLWPHGLQSMWSHGLPGFSSFTISLSLLKLMSIELMILSNHLILCFPLLLLSSVLPSNSVFASESVLHIRWPKYWSFDFTISCSNEYSGLISFRIDWFDLLSHQTLTVALWTSEHKYIYCTKEEGHHSSKKSCDCQDPGNERREEPRSSTHLLIPDPVRLQCFCCL